jgi:hypothetical protein
VHGACQLSPSQQTNHQAIDFIGFFPWTSAKNDIKAMTRIEDVIFLASKLAK